MSIKFHLNHAIQGKRMFCGFIFSYIVNEMYCLTQIIISEKFGFFQ